MKKLLLLIPMIVLSIQFSNAEDIQTKPDTAFYCESTFDSRVSGLGYKKYVIIGDTDVRGEAPLKHEVIERCTEKVFGDYIDRRPWYSRNFLASEKIQRKVNKACRENTHCKTVTGRQYPFFCQFASFSTSITISFSGIIGSKSAYRKRAIKACKDSIPLFNRLDKRFDHICNNKVFCH